MGGDEFCIVVARHDVESEFILTGAANALAERGDGFAVTAAYGHVLLPEEASTPPMRFASPTSGCTRTSRAHGGPPESSRAGSSCARSPNETRGWAIMSSASRISRRSSRASWNFPRRRSRAPGFAAALHDVGKMAIPDAILEKPGPLSADEWKFLRRHTLIGERILLAAPALSHIAALVRSSHERSTAAAIPTVSRGPTSRSSRGSSSSPTPSTR